MVGLVAKRQLPSLSFVSSSFVFTVLATDWLLDAGVPLTFEVKHTCGMSVHHEPLQLLNSGWRGQLSWSHCPPTSNTQHGQCQAELWVRFWSHELPAHHSWRYLKKSQWGGRQGPCCCSSLGTALLPPLAWLGCPGRSRVTADVFPCCAAAQTCLHGFGSSPDCT